VTDDCEAGHPILCDHSLTPEFANLSGDQGASPIVKRHQDRLAMIKLGGSDARLDLDTPEDWEQFRQKTGR
jgi:CTP:molybdopterin cytidylyltransferase MocA